MHLSKLFAFRGSPVACCSTRDIYYTHISNNIEGEQVTQLSSEGRATGRKFKAA